MVEELLSTWVDLLMMWTEPAVQAARQVKNPIFKGRLGPIRAERRIRRAFDMQREVQRNRLILSLEQAQAKLRVMRGDNFVSTDREAKIAKIIEEIRLLKTSMVQVG